jgi:hypothetical protein
MSRVDLVVFSFDRPMQLYAFLESTDRYITGLEKKIVIYRTSDRLFEEAYKEVAHTFPSYKFVQQKATARKNDFKDLVIASVLSTPSEYIIFGVDDIIVKDHVELDMCVDMLEKTGAYGFYLRLGKNITRCYMSATDSGIPPLTNVAEDCFSWIFAEGRADWAYPNTVDMTVFKKDYIKNALFLDYHSPNTFEGIWACHADVSQRGLCFGISKIVNLPLNSVQKDWENPHMHSYTAHDLLKFFNEGYRIDTKNIASLQHNSPHVAYVPKLVQRYRGSVVEKIV